MMGAFDGELAELGYRSGVRQDSEDNRQKVTPTVGVRVEYGYNKKGTVTYVSDSLVVVRWDSPQRTKYGGWTIQEEAVPAHHSFYESKGKGDE